MGKRLQKRLQIQRLVCGGISILGTTGFVKPISATAYLDSIKTEINFAYKNGLERLYLLLEIAHLNLQRETIK